MKLAAVLVFLAGFMLLFNASVYAAQAWFLSFAWFETFWFILQCLFVQDKLSRNHKKIKTEYYYDQQVVSFGVEVKTFGRSIKACPIALKMKDAHNEKLSQKSTWTKSDMNGVAAFMLDGVFLVWKWFFVLWFGGKEVSLKKDKKKRIKKQLRIINNAIIANLRVIKSIWLQWRWWRI